MKRVLRRAGVGATAFLAATAFAAPAFAETTADLELKLKGTTLAVDAAEKDGYFTIANHGPQSATDIHFVVDLTGLDDTKVTFDTTLGTCTPAADVYNCVLGGPIESGESWDFFFTLTKVGAATGNAGQIKVTIDSEQDENTANNSQTVDVVLSELSGVDLAAYAWDIYHAASVEEGPTDTPVEPGAQTIFFATVANWGDVASSAIKMEIKLPEGVTFVGSEPDCDYTDGSTSTLCVYKGKAGEIAPGGGLGYYFNVKVAETVAAPVVIPGGVFAVENVVEQPSIASRSAAPESTKPVIEVDIDDLDPSDNSDDFSAYVGKKGGSGGGLPVTGTQINVIAGAGVGAIVLGGVLFMLTRRRRVTA